MAAACMLGAADECQSKGVGMDTQQVWIDDFGGMMARMWLDGLDGQEDELEDVQKGKLEPPTAEREGEVVIRPNQDAIAQKKADEDEEELLEDLETRTPG